MTGLLLKLFIREPADYTSAKVRGTVGKMAGYTGIGCNILLFIGKILAGILSGSISVIADALNNLTDAASSVVTLIGFHMAR